MEHSGMYILDGKTPIKCPNTLEWGKWFAENEDKRRVANDELPGGIMVSTVFLGLDHRFDERQPVLFETMILGGEHDHFQERYFTWDEAEAGHKRAIELCLTVSSGETT